jgi:hypothetical protein
MAKTAAPNVPFVEARHTGGKQRPTAIVISLSSTTSEKGAALGIANYQHRFDAPLKSYHYVVDEEQVFRCIPDNVAAYGNPYRAINVQICAQPHEDTPLWEDGCASPVMHRAAKLVADLILLHKIKPRYIRGQAEERWFNHRWRRRGGLIIKVLGTWPYESFLDDVNAELLARKGARK